MDTNKNNIWTQINTNMDANKNTKKTQIRIFKKACLAWEIVQVEIDADL